MSFSISYFLILFGYLTILPKLCQALSVIKASDAGNSHMSVLDQDYDARSDKTQSTVTVRSAPKKKMRKDSLPLSSDDDETIQNYSDTRPLEQFNSQLVFDTPTNSTEFPEFETSEQLSNPQQYQASDVSCQGSSVQLRKPSDVGKSHVPLSFDYDARSDKTQSTGTVRSAPKKKMRKDSLTLSPDKDDTISNYSNAITLEQFNIQSVSDTVILPSFTKFPESETRQQILNLPQNQISSSSESQTMFNSRNLEGRATASEQSESDMQNYDSDYITAYPTFVCLRPTTIFCV